jgi:hypothetical protein
MVARSLRLILSALILGTAACLPRSPTETPLPESDTPAIPAGRVDQWSLWAEGTQLRGANIWQRIVVPELDGAEFLGDGYLGPPYTQADFERLAALGANYVNLSHPGLFTERPPYVLDEQVQANLDHLIEMAARADLFVVITFRTGPGRSDFTFYRDGAGDWFDPDLLVESLWNDPTAQDAWAGMWRYTAGRYRDAANVAGYDLLCEPNAEDVALGIYDPPEFYPAYAGTLYDWNRFYPRLVAAIREVDADTPILVSASGWGGVRWLPYLQPVDDTRIVYTVHQYAPHEYTITYPGRLDLDWDGTPDPFDRAWLDDLLGAVDEFRARTGAPVAVNEFGVIRWVPGAAEFLGDEIGLFEDRGLNYALWVWDPAWAPWSSSVNDFNFRFGPDPQIGSESVNDLQSVILEYWARNRLRPSSAP